MVFWVVRAGNEGQQESAAIENKVVTIGWKALPDLSGIEKASLKKIWQKIYPHHSKSQRANEMAQVYRFAREIQIGDLVALPLKSKPAIMLGEISSDYQYLKIRSDIHHTRSVDWKREIPRSEIDEDLLRSMGTSMTVFKIRKPNAEKRMKRIMSSFNQGVESVVDSQEDTNVPMISVANVPEVINEYRKWTKSEVGQEHMNSLHREIEEVRALVGKLRTINRNSSDFVDLVLYGLLPHSKTKVAKRYSMFPAFYNFKSLFSTLYHYKGQDDWVKIANLIYDLITKFQESPEHLDEWINDFVSEKLYSRGLQCGAISPILFCINNSFPIINNRVIHTYNDFATILAWHDNMSPKLDQYIKNVEKCKKLISLLQVSEFDKFEYFDEFCYWYDNFYQAEVLDEEEDDDLIGYKLTEKTKIPEVAFEDFLAKLNLENITNPEVHSLRNPERVKIIDLVRECSTGKWVLPNFQRYFDWKKNDVKDFLESIFRDYYVGCLLFWDVGNELQFDIMPINGVDMNKDEINPRLIILDGQQRITSLYYAIKAPKFSLKGGSKSPLYFYINFSKYFIGEQGVEIIEVLPWKLSREESFQRMLFPFYELENYGIWSYDFEGYLHKNFPNSYDKIRKIRSIMERKLLHIREGFEIPYITLPSSMELHNVTDIFERINTMGKILNVFDLLIARLSKYEINLRDLWDETVKRFPKFKLYNKVIGKLPVYIIQSMSLCYNKTNSCKKKDILNIYQLAFESTNISFEDKWYEISGYTDKAISKLENLRDGFGVKDETELPFAPTIPILSALIKETDSHTNKVDSNKKIKIWYWSSVFSNAYSSAVDSQLTLDFKEMKEWFTNNEKIPRTVERARREINTIDLRQVQVRSSAIYRGVLSLMALRGANDFETNLSLENARGNDKDHIFPKKKYRSEKNINSVLNITWVSEETNRRKGGKNPSEFCKNFLHEKYSGNEKEFRKTLETHLINSSAYKCMLQDDFEGFITRREELILSLIHQSIGMTDTETRSNLIPPSRFEISPPVINLYTDLDKILNEDESESLEFKSSIFTSIEHSAKILGIVRQLRSCSDGHIRKDLQIKLREAENDERKNLEVSIIKTIAAFMNTNGGTLVIGINDDKQVVGIEKDYEQFAKRKSWDGWLQHFKNLIITYMEHGKIISSQIYVSSTTRDGKTVAIIRVPRSQRPIFVKSMDRKTDEFYVRNLNTTDKLLASQTFEYIKDKWNS